MDPTANVSESRQLAAEIMAIWDNCADDGTFSEEQLDTLSHSAYRLGELFQALDQWLTRKGCLPQQWQPK